jgi:hypothetical protein
VIAEEEGVEPVLLRQLAGADESRAAVTLAVSGRRLERESDVALTRVDPGMPRARWHKCSLSMVVGNPSRVIFLASRAPVNGSSRGCPRGAAFALHTPLL